MNTFGRARDAFLPKPPHPLPSSSARVRQRRSLHHNFVSQAVAAINILAQTATISAEPFPVCNLTASAQRETAFIDRRVGEFLRACRDGGGPNSTISLASCSPALSF